VSLKDQFEAAVADSKNLPERPDNMTLLKLYALQAGQQRRRGRQAPRLHRHGRPRQVGRLERTQGHVADDAMQQYIDLIESLK
jgi:acyl-CoA-binding protein